MSFCYQEEHLQEMVDKAKIHTKKGKVATYIPALATADPATLAVAIYDEENNCFSAGDFSEKFTLQSISKVLALALVLIERGEEYVFSKVGMEPTGDPFNSIVKLETTAPSKPLNPMINAGALAVTNMLVGKNNDEKLERLLFFVQQLVGDSSINYNEKVAESEFKTADLNRALCYFMREHDVIEGDIEDLIDVYTKQCAIEMDCRALAKIGFIIGNEGRDPLTGREVIPVHIARIVKTFMVTCGMYNASGEFAIKVGIPAKSGVSGGVLGAVPYGMGIGIYGPALDSKGNSIAGMELLKMLSAKYRLSIF